VSDDQLCQLYNLCHAFVFPSLHEGFGLPVLEAMSCGVPVIASNTTSMPEVVGMVDALFDPLSEPDMQQKLLHVLTDDAFRQKLISHGARQALSYSWEQTARHALDAIERIVSFSPGTLARSAATPHTAGQSELQSVVQAIAQLPGRYTDIDLRQCAASLSLNHPQVRTACIYVDISELVQRDAATGVQRVTKNILTQLLKAPPVGYTVEAVYGSAHDYGYRCARRFTERFMGCPAGGDDTLIEPMAGDIFLGLDLQHHITQRQSPYLRELRSRGVAVHFVVYDLLPIQFPHYLPPMHALHVQWLYTLAQFDGAICISRTVADELLDWLNQHGPKRLRPFSIGWFHLGADIESSAPSCGLPPDAASVLHTLAARPTFLVVGTLEPRKGHVQTLAAFEQLWLEGLDINLVFVGKSGWLVEALVEKLRTHPELGQHLFWLTGVSDEFLKKIYAAANCLIAPSEGEGFGLPLIEAAQNGLPIIASDIPVFKEVAGDHATYFKGKTPEALAQAVRDWLQLDQSSARARVAGMPWLTWEQSAVQLQNVVCQNNWLHQWPSTLSSNPIHAA
jgi:glycosyltransferase involved in cell wall biosynthesis